MLSFEPQSALPSTIPNLHEWVEPTAPSLWCLLVCAVVLRTGGVRCCPRYYLYMNELPPLPDEQTATTMLQAAIGQIDWTRRYTLELLEATPRDRWFEVPAGLPTHVAWQVGHLTVSQYGLLMFRIRGRSPDDLELIPGRFRKTYGRGGIPKVDPSAQPTPDELLDRMNRVYELAMTELQSTDPAVLLEPVDMPYAVYPIKLGAILFCPLHEQIHAGQIGLLRRALGLEPVR